MRNIHFVLAIFLLVGATSINGIGSNQTFTNEGYMPPIKIEPFFAKPSPANPEIKGRLLTPAEGCGFSATRNARVVGGSPAKNGGWTWMALLGYRNQNGAVSFNCGGSLITSRHILTAAHCLKDTLWFVRLGEYDVTRTDDGRHEDFVIREWKKHEQYNDNLLLNDIGMILLERDVIFNERIYPVCLPVNQPVQSQKFVGANPFIAGWGATEFGQQSYILMQLQVPVLDHKYCLDALKRSGYGNPDRQIHDGVICAGFEGGKNACFGDSGGPLVLPLHENGQFPYYQIGVVSWGVPVAKEGMPTVYTSVQYHAPWIHWMLK